MAARVFIVGADHELVERPDLEVPPPEAAAERGYGYDFGCPWVRWALFLPPSTSSTHRSPEA